ncbi:MAG: hypothetical protein LBT81_02520 [Helicobacteraceae bacterium]|jgi:hypothetical protein|nr:hypothetical protein [Helicobacteraceae bacterium]
MKNDAKDSGNISKTRWTVYVAANVILFALSAIVSGVGSEAPSARTEIAINYLHRNTGYCRYN